MDPLLKYPFMIVGSIAAVFVPIIIAGYLFSTNPFMGTLVLIALGAGAYFWFKNKTKVRFK